MPAPESSTVLPAESAHIESAWTSPACSRRMHGHISYRTASGARLAPMADDTAGDSADHGPLGRRMLVAWLTVAVLAAVLTSELLVPPLVGLANNGDLYRSRPGAGSTASTWALPRRSIPTQGSTSTGCTARGGPRTRSASSAHRSFCSQWRGGWTTPSLKTGCSRVPGSKWLGWRGHMARRQERAGRALSCVEALPEQASVAGV